MRKSIPKFGVWLAAVLLGALGWTGAGLAEKDAPGLAEPPLWEEVSSVEPDDPASLAARGKIIFESKCVACHGSRGDGNGPAALFLSTPPRDFTKALYHFRSTKIDDMPNSLDLFRSISVGFQAYGMPSFAYLSEEDRWALVAHLKAFYPEWSKWGAPEQVDVGAEPPRNAGWEERGRALYEGKFDCKKCHGLEGRGDGTSVKDLKDEKGRPIRPRDFSLGSVFRKAGWRPRDTVRVAAIGIAGTPMPSHLEQLADPSNLTELWEIAWYVELLSKKGRDSNGK